MTELRTDCLRCNTVNSTFEVKSAHFVNHNKGYKQYDVFCVCTHCANSSVFELECSKGVHSSLYPRNNDDLVKLGGYVNSVMHVNKLVNYNNLHSHSPPNDTPENIAKIFEEGSICYTNDCFNASGSMFRTTIDVVTKALVETSENEPSKKEQKILATRIDWLISQKLIPEDLKDFAHSIRLDGNDGVHDATLTKDDATDLLIFTQLLLERIYTLPAKLEKASARRIARNSS